MRGSRLPTTAPVHGIALFQHTSNALLATLFFQGGWLASGSDTLAGTLPLALPARERAAANSLLIHSVLYWGKLIIVTSLAYVVARGPLYAHPLPALLLAIAVTAAVHLLAQTRPLRRLLACGIGTGELEQQQPTTSRAARVLFPLLGLLILAGCLVLLESHDHYFFTQCDAFTLGTPLALYACRSLWHGVFAPGTPVNSWACPSPAIRNRSTSIRRSTWPIFCAPTARSTNPR